MKILTLQLIAYGPFTDTTLDFSGRGPSLHLVYGPNEAGKSSALRALRNMFFGIPVRTADSFRHPHPRLRIGAQLRRSDGETIAFIRRKGQRKTLRGSDDQTPLDDDALASFLGGVDRDLFEQMFAIDHRDLVRGGEEIVSGGGRLGQALFAAGAGLIRLQHFQQRLDQTMEALFKPSGSKPRINRSVAMLKETRRKQKEALLLAKTWSALHDKLREEQARQAINRRDLADRRQAYGKLERIHEALPLIARRKEIIEALPALENIPELPETFAEKRRDAENTLAIAGNHVERTAEAIRDIEAKLSALSVPEPLLQEAPLVEALQHELGSFKKAGQDRPVLEARMQALNRQVSAKLSRAGLTDPDASAAALGLTPALISEIQEMGKTHERMTTRLESARRQRRELETEIAAREGQKQALPSPGDTAALQSALQTALEEGPLEKQLAATRRAISQDVKALQDQLKRQALWSGALDELNALACPSRVSIDRFEEQHITSARLCERLREEQALNTAALGEIGAELRSIEAARPVPTEGDLKAARALRNSGWQLVRRQLEGDVPDQADVLGFTRQISRDGSLTEAFQKSMDRVDHLADRLRREADQVSRKSMLEARRRQAEDKSRELGTALDAAREEQGSLARQWDQLWSPAGIQPLPPAEMRAWLAEMEALRDKRAALRLQESKAAELDAAIAAHRGRLIEALADGEGTVSKERSLADLIDRARHRVASREALRVKIDHIDETIAQHCKALRKVRGEIDDLEGDMLGWKKAWGAIVASIGLEAQAGPAAALSMIESIREARSQKDEAAVLQKRIRGIARDADHFRERVGHLVDRLAPELKTNTPEEACLRLNARLTEARAEKSRQLALQRQLETAHSDLAGARKRLADAAATVKALCRHARCDDPAILPQIERRSRRRLALLAELKDLENRLRRLSAGTTVEAFAAEAETMAPDALMPAMARIADEIAALENERSALDQAIGTTRADLQRMDGRADAADCAEEAEHLLAGLESDVAQYARLKIASVILARTVEQYREKHQGPLINRASALFAAMTLNAFRGLRAEYDEKGSPVLVGIRSGGDEMVSVAGMSDGTADQLYLALRLASLERYLARSETLPFVVDDILLRFDDDRAAATLGVLAELARRTQVIFFTHHPHLVALARDTLDAAMIRTHILADGPPAPPSD